MAKWKLSRQKFGNEVFELSEGDRITIGRGLNNNITLSSIVISRNHCLIDVRKEDVSITDLKSSNGVYVGLTKITPNVPYMLSEKDVIGFGWTVGAPVVNVNDNEKYIFTLERCLTSITQRIQFQDNILDDIEKEIASFDAIQKSHKGNELSVDEPKLNLKRRLQQLESDKISKEISSTNVGQIHDDVINILSDSENETYAKKIKLEPKIEDEIIMNVKCEDEALQFEAFNVKQHYFDNNDELIQIISDSDSESEHWFNRLSQRANSPDIPKKTKSEMRENKIDVNPEDGSYSQLDDVFEIIDDEDEDEVDYVDDLITIPLEQPVNQLCNEKHPNLLPKNISPVILENANTELELQKHDTKITEENYAKNIHIDDSSAIEIDNDRSSDVLNGVCVINSETNITHNNVNSVTPLQENNKILKTVQMIEPLTIVTKRKSHARSDKKVLPENKSHQKSTKSKRDSSFRKITNSQKEERKKKLKQIACQGKDVADTNVDLANNTNKAVVNVKVTATNRGAFLSDVNQAIVKPTTQKKSPLKGTKVTDTGPQKNEQKVTSRNSERSITCDKLIPQELKKTKETCKLKTPADKYNCKSNKFRGVADSATRIPLKSLKPLTESKESCLSKPVSKVDPLPPKKPKKTVRFSADPPEVRVFEVEPDTMFKKIHLANTRLVDAKATTNQLYSLDKITLITILRWNPHWLEEQMKFAEPPPILSHKNPATVSHSFNSYKNYVRVIGDLILMEIWECLTQGYNRTSANYKMLQFQIASCPSTYDRHINLSNISVDISLPTSENKRIPRNGDILILEFGPENARISKFVYVHNVKTLPSPAHNKNSFFNISLNTLYTEKLKLLKRGEVVMGRTLAYINNELKLFEAIEYLAESPLSRAILKPDPLQYPKIELNNEINFNSQCLRYTTLGGRIYRLLNIEYCHGKEDEESDKVLVADDVQYSRILLVVRRFGWTMALNASQKLAVSNSVSAALSDQPGIQMVQGPPGTGKSGVICAIVMTYLYDASGKKHQDRGKILICATSNAAVDELVIRMLKIRQNVAKTERFGMVRVGRLESMHERAADVSSQRLAERMLASRTHAADAASLDAKQEISQLEAKINMWKGQQREAKNPERAAYCQGRVTSFQKKLSLLQCSNSSDRLAQAERRTIMFADIVVTTLASSHSYKMKDIKGRIALCIVDEAGQAIEPETLIPLTLDVTRLTLIGDPQQLPGYICSQRAKNHGLGDSLFSRLTSCSEQWVNSPVVLLDHQYRMQPAIVEYPNNAFYDGRVHTVAPSAIDLPGPPYLVLGIASGDKGQGGSGANEREAWGVARLAAALTRLARPLGLSLAVITPYCAHRDLLREYLRALSEPRVEVNTVDSFQGQERDVVLVSLARSHGVGFLTDAGRMNVMLTRARHRLVVCLNPHAFVKNNQWQTLIDDARRRNLYRTLPIKLCQSPSNDTAPDDILDYVFNPKSSYHK